MLKCRENIWGFTRVFKGFAKKKNTKASNTQVCDNR
jgi:hypothetical protein